MKKSLITTILNLFLCCFIGPISYAQELHPPIEDHPVIKKTTSPADTGSNKKTVAGPKIYPFTLELNQVGGGTYQPAVGAWVQDIDLYDKRQLLFNYTLKNKVNTKIGRITGDIDGIPSISPAGGKNNVPPLAPNKNFSGYFLANVLPAGKYAIHLSYITQELVNPADRGTGAGTTVETTDEFDYVINNTILDRDSDELDDRTEAWLLSKFRPYYKFTIDRSDGEEQYRPADALWYIQRCDFYGDDVKLFDFHDLQLNNATAMISYQASIKNSSDIGVNPTQAKYRLKPVVDGTLWGADWKTIQRAGNIGLYGHVVPIRLKAASAYDRKAAPAAGDQTDPIFYKIEYWQFYAYNEDHAGALGEHEGDWTTVQVIFDPRGGQNEDSIANVLYYQHGTIEMRFNMFSSKFAKPYPMKNSADQFIAYEGRNYGGSPCVWEKITGETGGCSDNTVIFSQDPDTKRFTHPVVYIENGAHEPWPTSSGYFEAASSHEGDDYNHAYLTTTPPNIGEADHPAPDVPGAFQIVRYNGRWGKDGAGGPPQGPILHWEWTWPANSRIRWQITPKQFGD